MVFQMISLDNIQLEQLLPDSLRQIPDVKALSQAISVVLQKKYQEEKQMINGGYKDAAIDLLAWEKHVDFYDPSLSLEQKKKLVDEADEWHKRKGTPWAVEQVVSIIFQNAKVQEWFEYGGDPFRFRIETEQVFSSSDDLTRLLKLVDATKNKRSRLEEITIKRNVTGSTYFGGIFSGYQVTEIYPEAN